RRRHTRFKCDWSSDVCSSDLPQRNESPLLPSVRNQSAESRRKRRSLLARGCPGRFRQGTPQPGVAFSHPRAFVFASALIVAGARSEERRVGKEYRSRGAEELY